MSNKFINCKTCESQIAKKAKVCPQCGAKNKKPFYTNWFLWLVIIVIGVIITSTVSNSTQSINLLKLTKMNQQEVVDLLGKPSNILIEDDQEEYRLFYNSGFFIVGSKTGATLITYKPTNNSAKPYELDGAKIGSSFQETAKKLSKSNTFTSPSGDRFLIFTTSEGYSCAYVASKDGDAIIGFMVSTDSPLDANYTIDMKDNSN